MKSVGIIVEFIHFLFTCDEIFLYVFWNPIVSCIHIIFLINWLFGAGKYSFLNPILSYIILEISTPVWHIFYSKYIPSPLFLWGLLWNAEVPGPGIEPMLQQRPKLLQWQCWVLNLPCHKRTLTLNVSLNLHFYSEIFRIQFDNLCILLGVFGPFTFHKIINIFGLKFNILQVAFYLLHLFSVPVSFFSCHLLDYL